ncbi:unnamed protein product [Rotaria sp. Silwood2]|nr:unnamed protein product [Rotaria sp. Silwood2]
MVRTFKKTTTQDFYDKNKENPEIFVLMRDIVTNTHHIVQRRKVITSKKIEKLQPGDEVSFGNRGDRIRCTILMIGKIYLSSYIKSRIYFVLGTEGQCKNSLVIVEKASASKNKLRKSLEKKIVEDDSDQDSISNCGIDENEEEDNSDHEEELRHHNEKRSSNDVHVSESAHTQSTITKETKSDKNISKRKLSSENELDESTAKRVRGSNGKTVSANLYAVLRRKVESLEAQVLEYQTTWMPRPTDRATIDYLIDIGKVLSGENESTNDDKSNVLEDVVTALDVTEQQLEKCIGKNIRITVRKIMKLKHLSPPPGFKFADVDQEHISAARDYARLMHPREERFYTDGDLNHAMGNVFAANTRGWKLPFPDRSPVTALHQQEASVITIDLANNDDIIDANARGIYDTIGDSVSDNALLDSSAFLKDAIDIFSPQLASAVCMRDICDGAVYRKLQSEITGPFITLTLNADGIQPHKSSTQTIWPILLVINEIPLKRRFSIENIILAGVWPGPSKPTRNDMNSFLRPLVDELLRLEQGENFELHNQDDDSVVARVFLIGACCDKPDQALLQCLPEPHAAFGCGRCEVEEVLCSFDEARRDDAPFRKSSNSPFLYQHHKTS